MPIPEYPIFSKKHQQAKRGKYDFGKKDFHLAEKWFRERCEFKSNLSVDSKPFIPLPKCTICKFSTSINISSCCKIKICNDCFNHHSELYNRCSHCKKVINYELYELYDGLNLKIPSYDDFYYEVNSFFNPK